MLSEAQRTDQSGARDAEIEAIIARGEPGINDLVTAYEPVEQEYVRSVEASSPAHQAAPIVSSTGALEEL